MFLTPACRRALWLGVLGLSTSVTAIRVLPASPLSSIQPSVQPRGSQSDMLREPTRWDPPTLELLITVRALAELNQRGGLSGSQASQVRKVLEPLTGAPRLEARQAAAVLSALDGALGQTGQRELRQARLRLEQRVHLQLASSRLARDEAPGGRVNFRLAFLVPGGQATVEAVQRDAEFNPFLQGVPASTLRKLLLDLKS